MLSSKFRFDLFRLLLGALILGQTPLWAQDPGGVLRIPRVDRPPELEDFRRGLHENNGPPGIAVRVAEFVQREPGDGDPVSQPTAAYLSYDDANLHIVFVCRDDPAQVRANIARREDIHNDDQVFVYLDTFYDRKRAYLFVANPLGVQRDGIRTEGQGENMTFDAVWTSEGQLTDDGYIVRISIPFRSLRFENSPEQTWGIALGRKIQRMNEEAYWPYITDRLKGFVPQFARLDGLAGISPGRNVQVNPYAMLARARVFDDDIPGHVSEGDERIGLDAKTVLRDAFTLDATLNPDFSQVESDDPQVTVNQRFEVFFPEKRPFFLENAGYFETPINLFFSRRIVDPGVGLRLTGKANRWAVGALAMNDRAAVEPWDPAAGSDAWIGALRVQRELGEESTAGLLVTDREFIGSRKNDFMFSADGRWRAGDNWEFLGQLMRSETRDHGGTRASGWGLLGAASYETRHFDYSGNYEEYGPEFDAPLGFVNRVNYRRTEQEVEYAFRPNGLVTQYGPALTVMFNWDHRTGRLQDREVELQFSVELVRGTEVQLTRVEAFELYDGLGFNPDATELQFETEWLKWLAFDASYAWGMDVNHDPADGLDPFLGSASEWDAGFTVRPTPRLRFDQSYVQSSMRTDPGSVRVFTERELRGKLNYQFSRELSLRLILDYDLEDVNTELVDEDEPRQEEWAVDVLLTYLLHPGTALYLGYTDDFENLEVVRGEESDVIRGRSPNLSVARQLFVKVSYLFRL